MKLLVFGDLHAADRPPGGRVDDYTRAILDKLDAIAKLCDKYEVSYALGTGDIFHIKQPNRVSHNLVQQLILTFKRFPCEVLVVPGNHDLGSDGLVSLSRQPLGTLEKAGAIRIILDPTFVSLGSFPAWVIPHPYNAVADGVPDGKTDPTYYAAQEAMEDPMIGLAHGSLLARSLADQRYTRVVGAVARNDVTPYSYEFGTESTVSHPSPAQGTCA